MRIPKMIKSACLMVIIIFLVCCVNNKNSFSRQSDSGVTEKKEDGHMKCLQVVAETTIEMLIASRSVIAKNQELINRDPATGNYSMKGFVPAVVGSQIANDFSLMTGHKLKQTSLKVRNPSNSPRSEEHTSELQST